VLPDGTYDVIVVDAEAVDGGVGLDLTILAGEHKGDVVSVRASNLSADPDMILATPATLTVTDGVPKVELEP
jgi:hypothetical protein